MVTNRGINLDHTCTRFVGFAWLGSASAVGRSVAGQSDRRSRRLASAAHLGDVLATAAACSVYRRLEGNGSAGR